MGFWVAEGNLVIDHQENYLVFHPSAAEPIPPVAQEGVGRTERVAADADALLLLISHERDDGFKGLLFARIAHGEIADYASSVFPLSGSQEITIAESW